MRRRRKRLLLHRCLRNAILFTISSPSDVILRETPSIAATCPATCMGSIQPSSAGRILSDVSRVAAKATKVSGKASLCVMRGGREVRIFSSNPFCFEEKLTVSLHLRLVSAAQLPLELEELLCC